MTHWNHRVVKRTHNSGEETYGIHEVFYDGDDDTDSGDAISYTTEPVCVSCGSLEALREYLQWMINCLDKEVIVEDKEV